MTRTDSSYVDYTYDNIGQLVRALGSGGQSTENLGYGYDKAWNLNQRTNVAVVTTFTVNLKNELTHGPVGYNYHGANGNLTSQTYGVGEHRQLVDAPAVPKAFSALASMPGTR